MSLEVVPRSSSLATSYAQNYLSHPGFDWAEAVDTFLPQRHVEKVLEEISAEWNSTKADKIALIEELRRFQAKMQETAGGRQPGQNVDLKSFAVPDVFEALERAKKVKRTSTYKFICNIGKHCATLKQWIGLLPNGDYGSGICGAFTILLDATERIYSVDSLVFECLSDIPAALQKMGNYLTIYQEQQPLELIKKSVELYRSVVVALTGCVKYSWENASRGAQAKRFIGSLFKGENYKHSLKDSINNVSEISSELDRQAVMCQHKRIGGIYEMMKQKDRRKRADSIDEPLPIKERQMVEILNTIKDHFESHSLLDRKGHIIETDEVVPPGEPLKQTKEIRHKRVLTGSTEAESQKQKGITEDLLDLIAYSSFIPAQDLNESAHVIIQPQNRGSYQLVQAARSEELRTILRPNALSSVLSIHANSSDTSNLSQLSFLSAQLSQMLFSAGTPIVLTYFCSLHAESWDPRANAMGLIASLAGQLLSYPTLTFDLSFVDSQMDRLLDHDNFTQLVQLFLSLLHQLPPDAYVICFIDEVSVYETPEREVDMRTLLATLVKQVIKRQEEDKLPVFKLLLTDGGSSNVGQIIGMENVLELSEDGEGEDMDPLDIVRGVFEDL